MNLFSISPAAVLLTRCCALNAATLTAHSLLITTEGSHEQLNG
jgi:hypothetical protein